MEKNVVDRLKTESGFDRPVSIAIDGPSGVGKSTIAKALADEFKYVYLDTGAIFRTLAVYCLDSGIRPENEKNVSKAVNNAGISIKHIDREQHMYINGEDVTSRIRDEKVSKAASVISRYSAVRNEALKLERGMAKRENVIMDGRDIGTVVLPFATLKIFLTASPKVRAERRYRQLAESGGLGDLTFDDILKQQNERDFRDSHRDLAPLKAAEDAVTIDTSDITVKEVCRRIKDLLFARMVRAIINLPKA